MLAIITRMTLTQVGISGITVGCSLAVLKLKLYSSLPSGVHMVC